MSDTPPLPPVGRVEVEYFVVWRRTKKNRPPLIMELIKIFSVLGHTKFLSYSNSNGLPSTVYSLHVHRSTAVVYISEFKSVPGST